MAPKATAIQGNAKPKRKRARKTRTAIISDTSSSSSSSSDSDSDSSDEESAPVSTKVAATTARAEDSSDSDSDAQSSSSSSSNASISMHARQNDNKGRRGVAGKEVHSPPPEIKEDFSDTSDDDISEAVKLKSKSRALRPPTPPLRSKLIEGAAQKRKEALQMKNEKKAAILASQRQTVGNSATREEDFQAVWMRMMVDEFGEELDALRKKEPNLTTEGGNRMPLLIDALQAGSEIFSRGVDAASSSKSMEGTLESDDVGLLLWTNKKAAFHDV